VPPWGQVLIPEGAHHLPVASIIRIRTAPTVGNCDYIADIVLREDGDIEVETVFAGHLETRRVEPAASPEECKFTRILLPDLAAPGRTSTSLASGRTCS